MGPALASIFMTVKNGAGNVMGRDGFEALQSRLLACLALMHSVNRDCHGWGFEACRFVGHGAFRLQSLQLCTD